MKHNKIFRVLALAVFAAAVVTAPLAAAPDCGKPGCPKKGEQEKMAGKDGQMKAEGCPMLKAIPNLSDEQKAKLEKLHAEHMKAMAAMMAEMQKKCQEQHQAVRALLSDEQKAKLGEMGSGKGCGMMLGGMHGQGGCLKGAAHAPAMAGHDCKAGAKMPEQKKACCEAKAKAECEKKAAEEKK